MTRPPIVMGALYEAVAGRDDEFCQCVPGQPGECGRTHTGPAGACERGAFGGRSLVVVPIDPAVPLQVAVTLPADHLIALCSDCCTRRTNAAAKARRATLAEAATPEALFEMED